MKRISRLDGLRALAFLAVFLNHSVYVPMAWVGVDLFFVLSGFLITTILLAARGQPAGAYFGEFYARRARRILPPYFLVLLLVAVIGFEGIDWPRIWWHFLLFVQNSSVALGHGTGVLTPYWSLAVEEQYYLIWPVLVFLLPRRALVVICIAMIVAAPALRAWFTPRVEFYTAIFCLTPFRMDLLAAGALLGIINNARPAWLGRALPWSWLGVIVGAAGLFIPALLVPGWRASAHSLAFNTAGYSLSVLCFSSLLAVVLASPHRLPDRVLSWAPLMWIGQISYMCYLLHEPMLHLVYRFVPGIAGALAAFALTVTAAALSWRFLEKPLLAQARGQGAGSGERAIRPE